MPEMNGLEVARRMDEWQSEIFFIFATACPNYAMQAFELYSFDYILKPDEISYFESCRAKIIIKTLTKMYCVKGNLHTWEQQLASYGIVQNHRSYLVNINQVKEIGYINRTYELTLKSGDRVPLSRSCGKQIRKMLSNRQK